MFLCIIDFVNRPNETVTFSTKRSYFYENSKQSDHNKPLLTSLTSADAIIRSNDVIRAISGFSASPVFLLRLCIVLFIWARVQWYLESPFSFQT